MKEIGIWFSSENRFKKNTPIKTRQSEANVPAKCESLPTFLRRSEIVPSKRSSEKGFTDE